MVLSYTPRGNATHPCAGVEEFNAKLIPFPNELRSLHFAIYSIYVCITGISVVLIWLLRHHPRFLKVRPVALSYMLLVGLMLYITTGLVGSINRFPCAFMSVCYLASFAFFATSLTTRALVTSFEAQYAQMAGKLAALTIKDEESSMGGDNATTTASRQPPACVEAIVEVIRTTWILFRVCFGLIKMSQLSFHDIKYTKQSYKLFAFLFFFPFVFFLVALIYLVEPMHFPCACTCRNIFLETPIMLVVWQLVYVPMIIYCVFVTYRIVGWDSKGVVFELFEVAAVAGGLSIVVWFLISFDPMDLTANAQFEWQLLTFLPVYYFWYASFGKQFRFVFKEYLRNKTHPAAALRRSRKMTKQPSTSTELVHPEDNGNLQTMLNANPTLKQEFMEFAAEEYVMESIQFLQDVQMFQDIYFQKGEGWRRSKAKLLCKLYIEIGADLQINISDRMRETIKLACFYATEVPKVTVFDDAQVEIEEMIRQGCWHNFISARGNFELI
jgi:hypothetical protein